MRHFGHSLQKMFLLAVGSGMFVLGTYFVITPPHKRAIPDLKRELVLIRSEPLRPQLRDVTPRLPAMRLFTEKQKNSSIPDLKRKLDLARSETLRPQIHNVTPEPLPMRLFTEKHTNSTATIKAMTFFLDTELNETENKTVQPELDPSKRYLVIGFSGQLGNVLFELATAHCVAKLNNLTLVVNDVPQLEELNYHGIVVQGGLKKALAKIPVRHHVLYSCCKFVPEIMTLNSRSSSHYLHGYLQSWKYFEPCKTDILQTINFKDRIINKADSIVKSLRQRLPGRQLVAVHVRMEDYLTSKAKRNGKKVAPPVYFRQAMTYFRSNFRGVFFVVVASNKTWFEREVTNAPDVLVLERSDSPGMDMEVLSRLDHVIFSVGTFGWWIGFRSKGTVVYYKDFYVPHTRFGQQMWNDASDYIYPGWIPL